MTWTRLPALEEALNVKDATRAYVLVDSALYGEPQRRHPLGIECATLEVSGADEAEAQAVLPLLMAWPEDDEGRQWLLPRSIQWAQEHHAVTWLRSHLGLKELAAALARRMDAQLDDGTEVLLRFADARILGPLWSVLTDAQRATLFAPVERWWYLDRQEQLQELPLQRVAEAEERLPFVLLQAQLNSLLDAAEPDVVMQQLRELVPDALEGIERPARHGTVRRYVDQARQLGIDAVRDLAVFCALILKRGDATLERMQWHALVQQVRSERLTWTEALTSKEIWS